MTSGNFAASLALVLISEGGNDDDPKDHGGRTSRGITQREYDAWCRENGKALGDVWKAADADIAIIYEDEYWSPNLCDLLPRGLDYFHFNNCVLAGPARGAKLLQQALRINADGRLGPVTRERIRSIANAAPYISELATHCRQFYLGLHQPRFTKGWLNRVGFVEKHALKMITVA